MSCRGRRALRVLDSIDFYQNVIYATLLLWGLYLVVTGESVYMISRHLSPFVYGMWVTTHIAAPLTSWAGQLLHRRRAPFTWELRWAADASICFILVTAIIAFSVSGEADAKYRIAVYVLLALCAFLLAFRDIAHIVYREHCTKKAARNVDQLG